VAEDYRIINCSGRLTLHLPTIVVVASAQAVEAPAVVTFEATTDFTTSILWQESTDGETWEDIDGEISNNYSKISRFLRKIIYNKRIFRFVRDLFLHCHRR